MVEVCFTPALREKQDGWSYLRQVTCEIAYNIFLIYRCSGDFLLLIILLLSAILRSGIATGIPDITVTPNTPGGRRRSSFGTPKMRAVSGYIVFDSS